MSTRQPTFRQRIRLLQIASAEISEISEHFDHQQYELRLREVAEIISAEVARMEHAAARWEQNAQRKNAKTASPETVITRSS